MKTPNFGESELRAIQPSDAVAYLVSRSWRRSAVWRGSPLFALDKGGQHAELLLPDRPDLADYPHVVAELLAGLATVEQRPAWQIARDIQAALADVIRVQLRGSPFDDGTAPLDRGLLAAAWVGDLVTFAAWAAIRPRAVYQSRRPEQLNDFLRLVKPSPVAMCSHCKCGCRPWCSQSSLLRSPTPPSPLSDKSRGCCGPALG